MGDNKRGDIKELCQIAKPTIGIITNVGKDHLGGYKNQKENVATKLELFDYLKEQNGVVLVNSEDADLMNAAEHIEKSIYTPSNYEVKLENAYLTYKQKDAWIPTKLYGLFNIANIACAKALGDHFATNNKEMDKAISNYEPLLMRSQIVETKTNTIILDAYNANPSSMVLALDSFNILESKNKKSPFWVICWNLELKVRKSIERLSTWLNSMESKLICMVQNSIKVKMTKHFSFQILKRYLTILQI